MCFCPWCKSDPFHRGEKWPLSFSICLCRPARNEISWSSRFIFCLPPVHRWCVTTLKVSGNVYCHFSALTCPWGVVGRPQSAPRTNSSSRSVPLSRALSDKDVLDSGGKWEQKEEPHESMFNDTFKILPWIIIFLFPVVCSVGWFCCSLIKFSLEWTPTVSPTEEYIFSDYANFKLGS